MIVQPYICSFHYNEALKLRLSNFRPGLLYYRRLLVELLCAELVVSRCRLRDQFQIIRPDYLARVIQYISILSEAKGPNVARKKLGVLDVERMKMLTFTFGMNSRFNPLPSEQMKSAALSGA